LHPKPQNAFYAQSGGVTAVINATASGLLSAARQHKDKFGTVYAGRNGILGGLNDDLIDTSRMTDAEVAALKYTPGGAFGSCRHQLKSFAQDPASYEKLIATFKKHNIGFFFYNGGGDSQDTAHKISEASRQLGFPVQCIGIPKTIDNDLPFTDNCPGFGSVAKYVAVSIREAAFDVASMAATSTKVFILEVMGRHAGWIAAASGLATEQQGDAPHVILFPEIAFDETAFLAKVNDTVKALGFCAIVVSEGVKNQNGEFLSEVGGRDAFGHAQLGGVAPRLAELIQNKLKFKVHNAVSDYLQRSARHIASQVDVDQAFALGQQAITFALDGKSGIMLTITRKSQQPYQWGISHVPLEDVANQERFMPRDYISADGFHITSSCREYLQPLIQGEAYPPYELGLPKYHRFDWQKAQR